MTSRGKNLLNLALQEHSIVFSHTGTSSALPIDEFSTAEKSSDFPAASTADTTPIASTSMDFTIAGTSSYNYKTTTQENLKDYEVILSGSDDEDPYHNSSDDDPNYEPSEGEELDTDTSSCMEENFSGSDHSPDSNERDLDVAFENNETEETWQPIKETISTIIIQHALKPRITGDINEDTSALEVFSSFVTDELLDKIVRETNLFAAQDLEAQELDRRRSRQKQWTDITTQELKNFFAVVICMGLVKVPNLQLYWSRNSLYHNTFISSIMCRDRFLAILKYLHFNDNEGLPSSTDKLYKLRPVLEILNEQFKKKLTPGRNIVIDESMVPWRGRLGMRQYIKNKRHKYGVKLYKLCTVEGYTYKVKVYCGKEDTIESKGHSHKVVLNLTSDLLDAGRTLYADNFYSSVPLAEELLSRQTLYCGTLRSNRKGVPKDFVSKKLKQNEICGVENRSGIKIIKWQDKRPVLMITSKPDHTANLQDTGKKNRTGENILKPKPVIEYNKAKKGVDYSDQMSAYYSSLRKGLKWYRKVVFELIFGASIVNSWIIYNETRNRKIPLLKFRELLATQLISHDDRKTESEAGPKRYHTLKKEEGNPKRRRRNCADCYKKLRETMTSKEADKKVSKVTTYCEDCEKSPALCLSCFNIRHKNK